MVTEAEVMKKIDRHGKDCKKISEVEMLKSQNKLFKWIISVSIIVVLSVWAGSIKTAIDFTTVKTQVQILIELEQSRVINQGTKFENSNSEKIRIFPGVKCIKSNDGTE